MTTFDSTWFRIGCPTCGIEFNTHAPKRYHEQARLNAGNWPVPIQPTIDWHSEEMCEEFDTVVGRWPGDPDEPAWWYDPAAPASNLALGFALLDGPTFSNSFLTVEQRARLRTVRTIEPNSTLVTMRLLVLGCEAGQRYLVNRLRTEFEVINSCGNGGRGERVEFMAGCCDEDLRVLRGAHGFHVDVLDGQDAYQGAGCAVEVTFVSADNRLWAENSAIEFSEFSMPITVECLEVGRVRTRSEERATYVPRNRRRVELRSDRTVCPVDFDPAAFDADRDELVVAALSQTDSDAEAVAEVDEVGVRFVSDAADGSVRWEPIYEGSMRVGQAAWPCYTKVVAVEQVYQNPGYNPDDEDCTRDVDPVIEGVCVATDAAARDVLAALVAAPAGGGATIGGSQIQYQVVAGDTLQAIATRYGTTVAVLLDLNPQITNANRIYVGQLITVETPSAPSTAGSGGIDAGSYAAAGGAYGLAASDWAVWSVEAGAQPAAQSEDPLDWPEAQNAPSRKQDDVVEHMLRSWMECYCSWGLALVAFKFGEAAAIAVDTGARALSVDEANYAQGVLAAADLPNDFPVGASPEASGRRPEQPAGGRVPVDYSECEDAPCPCAPQIRRDIPSNTVDQVDVILRLDGSTNIGSLGVWPFDLVAPNITFTPDEEPECAAVVEPCVSVVPDPAPVTIDLTSLTWAEDGWELGAGWPGRSGVTQYEIAGRPSGPIAEIEIVQVVDRPNRYGCFVTADTVPPAVVPEAQRLWCPPDESLRSVQVAVTELAPSLVYGFEFELFAGTKKIEDAQVDLFTSRFDAPNPTEHPDMFDGSGGSLGPHARARLIEVPPGTTFEAPSSGPTRLICGDRTVVPGMRIQDPVAGLYRAEFIHGVTRAWLVAYLPVCSADVKISGRLIPVEAH